MILRRFNKQLFERRAMRAYQAILANDLENTMDLPYMIHLLWIFYKSYHNVYSRNLFKRKIKSKWHSVFQNE